jgi:small multidrug resistance pump
MVVIGYGVSFYFLSLVLKTIPIGIAYAVWAGLGIILITAVGAVFFNQKPDTPALIGMILIILGVAVIHIYSNTSEL